MNRTLLFGFLLFSLSCLHAQDNIPAEEVQKQADSIFKKFSERTDLLPDQENAIDSAGLEKAEERHMNEFLNLQRDLKREKLHKSILYVSIGLVFLAVLIIGFRRKSGKT